jgi:hypothetical protein
MRTNTLNTLTAAIAIVGALVGCRSGSGTLSTDLAESDEGRFPHDLHAEVVCIECHSEASVLSGVPAMPGADDHAPCDRGQCHQAEFLAEPSDFCITCHEEVDPTGATPSKLAPYPPVSGPRSLASNFSHAQHVDFDAMEGAVGFHVGCTDCHAIDESGKPSPPGHAVCGRCHAPEAAPLDTPTMDRCDDCHRERSRKPSRLRRLIVGDLHFRHTNHLTDRRADPIRCVECHSGSIEATIAGRHPPPTTRNCVTCHDDQTRTPVVMRMRVCETCHATKSLTVSSIAPRSHLPERERPADHTLAFRTDHGADAEREAPKCAKCHTFMSGSSRDVCDQCHQTMRPLDHRVTWREFDHGPEAATRSDNCAVCHTTAFCTDCHSQTPRSHFPLRDFREFGHATPALYNMRACVTCHIPEQTCVVSGCHTAGP